MSDEHRDEKKERAPVLDLKGSQTGDVGIGDVAGRDVTKEKTRVHLEQHFSEPLPLALLIFGVIGVLALVVLFLRQPSNTGEASISVPVAAPSTALVDSQALSIAATALPAEPTQMPAAIVIAPSTPSPVATPSAVSTTAAALTNPQVAVCTLEDFEGEGQLIWWMPETNEFSYRRTSEQVYSGDQALRVSYTKKDTFEFLAAEVPGGACSDFSQGQSVRVWVFGEVNLLLKLEDQSGKAVDISDQSAKNPDGWVLLIFELSSVEKVIDLTRIRQLMFFPAPDDVSASGVFFIDDIEVHP